MESLEINGIGIMCGTSQDGIDLAALKFSRNNYNLLAAQEIELGDEMKTKLKDAASLSAIDYLLLDNEIGQFLGKITSQFITENRLKIDFVASHGVTIFHQPLRQLTSQIGSPYEIAAITKTTTISGFRNLDVALHGQGAPLVPGTDKYLFPDFEFTLNLGGFANISSTSEDPKGYDICVCNLALNELAQKLGHSFDYGGTLAAKGKINRSLLKELNDISFYEKPPPKSLGKEWYEEIIRPIMNGASISDYDRLRTVTEHVGFQIGRSLTNKNTKCLVTGGGAYNQTLIDSIKRHSASSIEIPSNEIINFKEAISFAYLGYRRLCREPNTFSSVTGATMDSCGGAVIRPVT